MTSKKTAAKTAKRTDTQKESVQQLPKRTKALRPYVMPLDTPDRKALREGFGDAMLELGRTDPRVVALCADLEESDRLDEFKKQYPDRFAEVGVAEQNLVGVAAGMAHTGKVAFVASFAVFCPGRSWDQIRVSGCYSNNDVKIYGGHAGITVGEDGATHQALEDVGMLRSLPDITIIVPADAGEMRKATIAAASRPGTVYLRGGRPKLPPILAEDAPFEIGKATVLREGSDVTIIACGIMVREAVIAAEELAKTGIEAAVINCHTIKPIDASTIARYALNTGAVVTAEEHQVTGGLGSAVAEVLAAWSPVPLERVGVQDRFGESGTWDKLLDKYGLRSTGIIEAVKKAISRKRSRGIVPEKLKVSAATLRKLNAPKTVPKRAPARTAARKKRR